MVEMVFFMPIIIVIWILMNFIHQAKFRAEVTQAKARNCAWTYALGECGSMPPDCTGSASRMPDGELRGAANWSRLESGVPGTSVNYSTRGLHGRRFAVRSTQDVSRPDFLGGSTTARGDHGTMCGDDPLRQWNQFEVWESVCRANGKSSWCR